MCGGWITDPQRGCLNVLWTGNCFQDLTWLLPLLMCGSSPGGFVDTWKNDARRQAGNESNSLLPTASGGEGRRGQEGGFSSSSSFFTLWRVEEIGRKMEKMVPWWGLWNVYLPNIKIPGALIGFKRIFEEGRNMQGSFTFSSLISCWKLFSQAFEEGNLVLRLHFYPWHPISSFKHCNKTKRHYSIF